MDTGAISYQKYSIWRGFAVFGDAFSVGSDRGYSLMVRSNVAQDDAGLKSARLFG